jgi:hypothetical protein
LKAKVSQEGIFFFAHAVRRAREAAQRGARRQAPCEPHLRLIGRRDRASRPRRLRRKGVLPAEAVTTIATTTTTSVTTTTTTPSVAVTVAARMS